MSSKSIPQLEETTTIDSDTVLAVDSGIQTFKMNAQTLATLFEQFKRVMTSIGDLVYGGSSGAPTRLAGNTTTTQKFLSQTGTGSASAAPAWVPFPTISGKLLNIQNFTAGGTYTPTVGTNSALIFCWGGGGGGGGNGTGSFAGTGIAGGVTKVVDGSSAVICQANGGNGGSGATASNVPTCGVLASLTSAVGNVFKSQGNTGGDGGSAIASGLSFGFGGNSPWLGGSSMHSNSQSNTGAGGSGATEVTGTAFCAAGGSSGGMSIQYQTGITGTYTVTIGAGGSGGASGTSGAAGFVAGSGFCLIFEYA